MEFKRLHRVGQAVGSIQDGFGDSDKGLASSHLIQTISPPHPLPPKGIKPCRVLPGTHLSVLPQWDVTSKPSGLTNRSRDSQQISVTGGCQSSFRNGPGSHCFPPSRKTQRGGWRSDLEGGQRRRVLSDSQNPPPPTSRAAPSVSTNMQPINVITELFTVPSKVQLGPNRQGWKQRKKLFLGFGCAILLAGFLVFCFFPFLSYVSVNLWYPCVWWSWPLLVSVQVFLPRGEKKEGEASGKS